MENAPGKIDFVGVALSIIKDLNDRKSEYLEAMSEEGLMGVFLPPEVNDVRVANEIADLIPGQLSSIFGPGIWRVVVVEDDLNPNSFAIRITKGANLSA
jgi:hypothetical protein